MAIDTQAAPPIPAEAIEEHRGKWIAVRGGKVIAVADNLDALRANDRVEPMDALYHVPSSPGYFF